MWQKLVQNNDIKDNFLLESQIYEYTLGEPLPDKPDYSCSDGGILIRVLVPTLLYEWETSIKEIGTPLFQIFKYEANFDTRARLYHEEYIKHLSVGNNRVRANIYLSPGRYYLRVSKADFTISRTLSFNPENKFIQFNDSCQIKKDEPYPTWRDTPTTDVWFCIFSLKFKIRKSDLYLGFEHRMFDDRHLLYGAFYHAPDPDGILRTFIFDGRGQVVEGMKI